MSVTVLQFELVYFEDIFLSIEEQYRWYVNNL